MGGLKICLNQIQRGGGKFETGVAGRQGTAEESPLATAVDQAMDVRMASYEKQIGRVSAFQQRI
jgi:hypothetical protein